MVAQTISLPNVRRMFIPDEGMMKIDCDLERADAQVVAWDAGDEELKDLFRSGLDIHRENAAAVFRIASNAVTDHQRQQAKQGVHASNYGSSAKTLAEETGMTIAEAEFFIKRWYEAHPAIVAWHEKIQNDLETKRLITNAFGFRKYFFDRLDIKKLHEALAWIPQSTVAICTNLGLTAIDAELPEVQLLNQVHDSLVMQAPLDRCPEIFEEILARMRVEVPYDDPLTIAVGLSASETSWGDVITRDEAQTLLNLSQNQSNELPTFQKKLGISDAMVQAVLKGPGKYGAKVQELA